MRSVCQRIWVVVGLTIPACSTLEINTGPTDAGDHGADVASVDGQRSRHEEDARDESIDAGGPALPRDASAELDVAQGAPSPDAHDAVIPLPDAADDSPKPSSSADSGSTDGAPDAVVCDSTLANECAADARRCSNGCPCVTDWTRAQQAASWCGAYNGGPRPALYPACDGYNLVLVGHTDTADIYYYDLASGKLVRIETQNGFTTHCWAGQSGTSVPITRLRACLDGASATFLDCSALRD